MLSIPINRAVLEVEDVSLRKAGSDVNIRRPYIKMEQRSCQIIVICNKILNFSQLEFMTRNHWV